MPESPEALIDLLLAAYREPLRYQKRLKGPLPEPFQQILQLAAGKASPEIQSLHARWKSNPEELRKAAIFYIEQSCLDGEEDPYRILGLNPGVDFHKIRSHYHLLMLLFHPDRAEASLSWRDAYAVRVNGAYRRLRQSGGRQASGREAKSKKARGKHPAPLYSYRHRQRKKSVLLYLVQRFPRTIRYLPHIILGSGIGITVILMVNLYLVRTTETGSIPFPPEKEIPPQEAASGEERAMKQAGPLPRSAEESALSQLKEAGTVFEENQPPSKEANAAEKSSAETPLAEPQTSSGKKLPPRSMPDQAPGAESLPVSRNFAADKGSSPVPREVARESRAEPLAKAKDPGEEGEKAAFSTLPRTAPVAPQKPQLLAAPLPIPPQALHGLLERFVTTYQRGDLEGFLTLFSADASTNDYAGKSALRQDYARFFSSTQARELQLRDLQWRIEGDRAQGKGRYIVQISKTNGTFESRGQIRFQVQNRQGAHLITGLFNTVDGTDR